MFSYSRKYYISVDYTVSYQCKLPVIRVEKTSPRSRDLVIETLSTLFQLVLKYRLT